MSCRSTSASSAASPIRRPAEQRDLWALVFTPVVSRYSFVWLTHRQTLDDVIAGFEAAWGFFGGVFATVIPDNMKTIVDQADPLEPRLNQAFVEYAQARGFVIDPARVRSPQDKPRVERVVPYRAQQLLRRRDLHRPRRRATAGRGVVPAAGRDAHPWHDAAAPGRALPPRRSRRCSAPAPTSALRRADLRDGQGPSGPSHRGGQGALLDPREPDRHPGRRARRPSAGAGVLPGPARQGPPPPAAGRPLDRSRRTCRRTRPIYAMRDLDKLQRLAAGHGDAIGAYAAALLDIPLPWTKMRQVYALLGLVKKWGPDRVNAACERALDAEAVNVGADRPDARTRHRDHRRHAGPPGAARHRRRPRASRGTTATSLSASASEEVAG